MKHRLFSAVTALAVCSFLVAAGASAYDAALATRLKGRILLQVESHGEAWYVRSKDLKRYYMKDGAAAYSIMRFFSQGITDVDLAKIPHVTSTAEMKASSSVCTSNALANRLRGEILLQVQQHGEAWYVDPVKCRAIYMKDGTVAYEVMRFLGFGVFTRDLEKIEDGGTAAGSSPGAASVPDAKPLFGTMIAFNVNDAAMSMSDSIKKGWTEFIKDGSAHQNLLENLKKLIQDRTKLVKATGFTLDRSSFVYFTWNVVEPQKGQFDWELTDLDAEGAANAGEKISAVIEPFASWDQKNTQVNANCKMLDAAYYDYKAGPPNDIAEYENFLTKTVDRYKGNVAVWEIGNENDAQCGGYENNPQGYFDLVKITSETIKKADPSAKVVNGGASGHFDNVDEISFWTKFFQLGGGQYIDYFNLHYNDERGSSPTLDPATFQKDLTFWNDLMDNNGGRKSLYLTEFGIYSGSPSSLQPSGQPTQVQPLSVNQQALLQPTTGQSLPDESAEAQAILYFKDSVLAFANGVETVFIDLVGPDDNIVGSSMAFNTNEQPRLFLTTIKIINQKLAGFSKAEKIADGQYKFTVSGKTIYAIWSGALPNEVSGQVKKTDMKGQEQILDAMEIKLKVDQPVFIER